MLLHLCRTDAGIMPSGPICDYMRFEWAELPSEPAVSNELSRRNLKRDAMKISISTIKKTALICGTLTAFMIYSCPDAALAAACDPTAIPGAACSTPGATKMDCPNQDV